MDSLYGGKQGASFVLKASYSSIEAMKTAGKQGANTTDVWYGDYVIIDTPNKNDMDNGKIFRRGLNYLNDNEYGGFEYIGQIVGPSSGTPYMQLNTIDQVKKQAVKTLGDYEYRRYPTGLDSDGNYTTSSGGDGTEPALFEFGTGNALVPGKSVDKNGEAIYNDTIKYTWCNIRNDNAESDSWYYVGWQVPYAVIDYETHMVSPYDDDGNIQTDATDIQRVDDYSHPFYEKWNIGVPKGVKGDTLRNLRVITLTAADLKNIYDYSQISINPTSGAATLNTDAEPGNWTGASKDVGREVVVFDYYVFDSKMNPTAITIYLGDFNIINKVALDDTGTLTIGYTHEDDTIFENVIQWVTNVDLTTGNGKNGGHFKLDYNNGAASVERDLTWVKDIDIADDGVITWTYAGTGETGSGINEDTGLLTKQGDPLKWITNVDLTTGVGSEGGTFTVTYNNDQYNGTVFNNEKVGAKFDLTWLKNLAIADDGSVTYTYSGEKDVISDDDGDVIASGVKTKSNLIKWVTSTALDINTGIYTINYNYGDPYRVLLDWVKDITIDEETGAITVHHTTGDATLQGRGDIVSNSKLKLITGASAATTGEVTFSTNTGEKIKLKQAGTEQDYKIKRFADNEAVTLSTNILDDKRIKVLYNTSTEKESIGDPINFIQDMVIRPSDYHLLVLFNDPTHRASAADLTDGVDNDGVPWVSNQVVKTFYTSPGTKDIDAVYWRDYGAVKDYSGILVGFNLTYETVSAWAGVETITSEEVQRYLKEKYPTGLISDYPVGNNAAQYGTEDLRGRIVTYNPNKVDSEVQDKEFYAFDYSTAEWYSLGQINDSGMRDATLADSSTIGSSTWPKLNSSGLVFSYTATNVSDNSLPTYWDPKYSWS